jgi:DNA-binding XRE family transcriptional regulator
MSAFTVTLKACRVNADKTQREWAALLGVTNVTVVNWENGKTTPTLDKLRKISQLSGIPMDYIFAKQSN